MNKQVKAALNAVKDFVSGRSAEANVPDADDQDLRKAVEEELLASMSGGSQHNREMADDQDSMRYSGESQIRLEQDRSRQLFMEHGYFDDAVQDLRVGKTGPDRAAAARALGLVGSQRATPHLIAAMFDDDVEVRSAAGEALNQIGDPTVPNTPPQHTFVPQTVQPAPPPPEAPLPKTQADHPQGDSTSSSTEDAKAEATITAETLPTETQVEAPATPGELPVERVGESSLVEDTTAASEEEQLLLEEHAVRETVEQYERQLVESAALRLKAENEARWRGDREAKIRADAEVRRVEEEHQRKRAEEESTRRRAVEQEALAGEHLARQQAELEAHRLAEEEVRLRLESSKLRQAAEELARQRRQAETTRREATEAARHAEATRARLASEKRHQDEVESLQSEEQRLNFAVEETIKRRSELEASRKNAENEIATLTDERNQLLAAAAAQIQQLKQEREQLFSAEAARRSEAERMVSEAGDRKRSEEQQLQHQLDALSIVTRDVSTRRFEIEAAREKAEHDAERLAEALTRMRAAEEARERAETERLRVEAATNERVVIEQRLLAEARRRATEEQTRLEEEKRRHDESEEQRIAALSAIHRNTELEARERAEKEKQLNAEIDHMRIADAEVRRRIEDAETLRRASEQAYKLAAEKVQRTEVEAHTAAQQEEQMLLKLESVRRSVAAEAHARADQERRIKEEIEQFRRLQDEERPRLEAAILQRTAAAARLQQMRDSRPEIATRPEGIHQAVQPASSSGTGGISGLDQSASDTAPLRLVSDSSPEGVAETMDHPPPVEGTPGVKPAVDSYLSSVDQYKRAAAISELARTRGKDAFPLIAASFDDSSPHVRNAAARALCQIEPSRTVDFFNRALEDGSEARRRNVGSAIAESRLAAEAIDKLASESREDTYNALSILFVMAKTGELKPLVSAIEQHPNDEVAQAVVKLLTLSGQAQLADTAMKKRHGE